jgi:hypothetical protein
MLVGRLAAFRRIDASQGHHGSAARPATRGALGRHVDQDPRNAITKRT